MNTIEKRQNSSLEKIIYRVSPIVTDYFFYITEIDYESGISITWKQTPTSNKSFITISFTNSTDAKGREHLDWNIAPKVILSNMEAGLNTSTKRRNWSEGIAIVFTLIATVQELSMRIGQFKHIVRTNAASKSLFEYLLKEKIYYYSDEQGNKLDTPKTWDDTANIEGIEGSTLFACQYPNKMLPNVSKFLVPDFANAIEDYYRRNLPA